MKYKIGERIFLHKLSSEKIYRNKKLGFAREMCECIGKEGIIINYYLQGGYVIDFKMTCAWNILEEDITSMREIKLKRILK